MDPHKAGHGYQWIFRCRSKNIHTGRPTTSIGPIIEIASTAIESSTWQSVNIGSSHSEFPTAVAWPETGSKTPPTVVSVP